MLRRINKGRKGFTLVELVVVNVVGSFNHPDNGDPFDPNDVDRVHKHHEDHGDEGHQHHLHPDHPDWNPLGEIQGADLTKVKDSSPAWLPRPLSDISPLENLP